MLPRQEWFWDAYIPDHAQRSEITASPDQATLEQLAGLPPTLLMVDEADVLHERGQGHPRGDRPGDGLPARSARHRLTRRAWTSALSLAFAGVLIVIAADLVLA